MELDYKAIGRRIKIARIRKDLTQEVLAEQVGLSPSHMSNIETGTTKVSLTAIVCIANALSVTVDDLLCDNLIHAKAQINQDIADALTDCSDDDLRLIRSIILSVRETLKSNKGLRGE